MCLAVRQITAALPKLPHALPSAVYAGSQHSRLVHYSISIANNQLAASNLLDVGHGFARYILFSPSWRMLEFPFQPECTRQRQLQKAVGAAFDGSTIFHHVRIGCHLSDLRRHEQVMDLRERQRSIWVRRSSQFAHQPSSSCHCCCILPQLVQVALGALLYRPAPQDCYSGRNTHCPPLCLGCHFWTLTDRIARHGLFILGGGLDANVANFLKRPWELLELTKITTSALANVVAATFISTWLGDVCPPVLESEPFGTSADSPFVAM